MIFQFSLRSLKMAFRPSRGNLAPLLFCLAAITALVVLFLLPRVAQNQELARLLEERRAQLQVQQTLQPIHQEFSTWLRVSLPHWLPQRLEQAVPAPSLTEATVLLEKMARDAGLDIRSLHPDAIALTQDDSIQIDGLLTGTLQNFLRFMESVTVNPWLLEIPHLEISGSPAAQQYRLRLMIAMDAE